MKAIHNQNQVAPSAFTFAVIVGVSLLLTPAFMAYATTTPSEAEDTTQASAQIDETVTASESETQSSADSESTSGSAGDAGETSSSTNEPEVEVDTGDAGAVSSDENNINENTTTVTATSSGSSTSDDVAGTSTLDQALDTVDDVIDQAGSSTETGQTTQANVENNNSATSTHAGTTTAETGSNTVDTNYQSASISTGDAVSYGSIVNIVNSNIFNSVGLISLLNNLNGDIGDIDLRALDIFNPPTNKASSSDASTASSTDDKCTDACDSVESSVSNENNAVISNKLVVRADTGKNKVDAGGDGSVSTGNAEAVADVVNIANTNITNSNYLMMVVNNFGDFKNDIVLPAAGLFESLFSSSGSSANPSAVQNENEASVNNAVSVDADTGGNTASSTGSSTIQTGDANASANVINALNENSINQDKMIILFRIHGDWNGEVFNNPKNVLWSQTGEGIQVTLDEGSQASSSPKVLSGSTSVSNKNKAKIDNDVEVYALTGDNKVAASGTSSVSTGNARATASILNIANTNVVGRNWMLAIINIFGDWDGDVSFGRPDLWVGSVAKPRGSNLKAGSRIDYHYTILNKGDAPASDVVLSSQFDTGVMKTDDGGNTREIGTLKPGESREVTMTAQVSDDAPHDTFYVTNTVSVSGREPDDNMIDNEDVSTVTVNNFSIARSSAPLYVMRPRSNGESSDVFPRLQVEKEVVSRQTVSTGESVEYKITISNDSDGAAYVSLLKDILRDQSGTVIQEQQWDLETIQPHEEIEVNYTVTFNATTPAGTYTNEAQVLALGKHSDPEMGVEVSSNIATASVDIDGGGEVLGALASAPATCEPLLESSIAPGKANSSEDVADLQRFLNDHEYAGALEVTGEYNLMTQLAVKAYQSRYADEILDPWGLSEPTGHVYHTTKKHINEANCGNQTTFRLTDTQLQEVESYRLARQESDRSRAAGRVVSNDSDSGRENNEAGPDQNTPPVDLELLNPPVADFQWWGIGSLSKVFWRKNDIVSMAGK